jgi:hypothetical protein
VTGETPWPSTQWTSSQQRRQVRSGVPSSRSKWGLHLKELLAHHLRLHRERVGGNPRRLRQALADCIGYLLEGIPRLSTDVTSSAASGVSRSMEISECTVFESASSSGPVRPERGGLTSCRAFVSRSPLSGVNGRDHRMTGSRGWHPSAEPRSGSRTDQLGLPPTAAARSVDRRRACDGGVPRDQMGASTQTKAGESSRRREARGVRRLNGFAHLRARPRSVHGKKTGAGSVRRSGEAPTGGACLPEALRVS